MSFKWSHFKSAEKHNYGKHYAIVKSNKQSLYSVEPREKPKFYLPAYSYNLRLNIKYLNFESTLTESLTRA